VKGTNIRLLSMTYFDRRQSTEQLQSKKFSSVRNCGSLAY